MKGEPHEEIGKPAEPQRHSVASIFAAASEILALNTSNSKEEAGIQQEQLQYSGTCDVVDVAGDTPHANEKGGKASTPNRSGSVDEFLHEKQMRPPASQTAEPESPRSALGNGKLPVVRKRDSEKPKAQKVQVDAFQALPSFARRFLPTQGIATPEEFLETNVTTMANALMNWRIKNQWNLSECSFINAQYCIYKWKSTLRGHLVSQEASQAVTTSTTPSTVCLNETSGHLDEELSNLSSLARRFLLSQGITTAKAFLAPGTKKTAEALMKWRPTSDPCECSIKNCREAVLQWKRDLHQRRHNHSGQEVRKVNTDLNHLDLVAKVFLSSQGIANAEAFRWAEIDTLTNALVRWRKREKMAPLESGAARKMILKWKKESQSVKPSKPQQTKPSESQKRNLSESKKTNSIESQEQQHGSMPPGERQPKVLLAGLDQAFEILSTPVQSFFVEQSILTPALLLQRDRQELARAFVEWRDRNKTRELKLGTAMSYVSEWRQISFAKVESPDGVTPLVARTNSYPSKVAQLTKGEVFIRSQLGAGNESRRAQGSRDSSHNDTATIQNAPENIKQRKHPPAKAIIETPTDRPIPQVRVQKERKIADAGTVATTHSLQVASETANLHQAWAHAHVQPAYKATTTVSSLEDESGTTATLKTADNRSACTQPANAVALDAPGEPHELSNDGNCYLSFLERDAIRFLASRGITTSQALLATNSKELAYVLMEARRGSTTFSSSYSSSYQHVYRWKRIVRQRQAADCDHQSLNMLPRADQKLLTSVGVTTADAFLSMKPTTLAHALIASRQHLNMKPWAFSTARQVIYRWIAVVRPKELVPIPALELLAQEPEERPVGLDPIFKYLSPSDQCFLAAQSIMTAHDLMEVGTKELARHLAKWKREKTRRDFKMSSATIYVGRWKGFVRSHAEGTETAASSLNADDTAGTSSGSGQRGTTAGTATVGNIEGNGADCESVNTDQILSTSNASAKSMHANYSSYEASTATKNASYHAETRTNDIFDKKAPTDAVKIEQNKLRTNGKMRGKVAKRPRVQLPPASVDEEEDNSIYCSHDDGTVQDVNSLAVAEDAEYGDAWADRKRPRTENAPNDYNSGTGISSIAPFVTNMKTFSYW